MTKTKNFDSDVIITRTDPVSKNTIYDFFDLDVKPDDTYKYARETCTNNNEFKINKNSSLFDDKNIVKHLRRKNYEKRKTKDTKSFTIIRNGTIIGKKGKEEKFIKMIAANDPSSLNDVKYNAEAYSVMPKYISSIEELKSCDLFNSQAEVSKNIIIIVGMEILDDFKSFLIQKYKKNELQDFKTIITHLLTACDEFNKYGFFHENLKYENIGLRIHTDKTYKTVSPVLTDFTETIQMNKIIQNDINPPLNSFYICVYILKHLTSLKITNSKTTNDTEISTIEYMSSRPLLSFLREKASYYFNLIQKLTKYNDDEILNFLLKNSYDVSRADVSEFTIFNYDKNTIENDSKIYIESVKKKNNLHEIILQNTQSYKEQLDAIKKYHNNKSSTQNKPVPVQQFNYEQMAQNNNADNQIQSQSNTQISTDQKNLETNINPIYPSKDQDGANVNSNSQIVDESNNAGTEMAAFKCDCEKCKEQCSNSSGFGRKMNNRRSPVSYRMPTRRRSPVSRTTIRRSPVSYRIPTARRSPVSYSMPTRRRSPSPMSSKKRRTMY